jgi:hypothetical protein
MRPQPSRISRRWPAIGLAGLVLVGMIAATLLAMSRGTARHRAGVRRPLAFKPRRPLDTGGFFDVMGHIPRWQSEATLQEVADAWRHVGYRDMKMVDEAMADPGIAPGRKIALYLVKAMLYNYEGDPEKAYQVLEEARSWLGGQDRMAETWLYTLVFYQGVTAMRRGENDNCILCRDESSCILPISPAAVHRKRLGSTLAIRHFREYLDRFPDELEVRWLLNLAHMTLGEYPGGVESRFLVSLERFFHSEFDIGRFRDVGHLVGLIRLNQAGGAVMEDFDNDGQLDVVVTAIDPTEHMAFYRNKGDGTFEDRSEAAGLTDQLGGLVCYQTDYDNDGLMDIFVARGAWIPWPIRPSLLRNVGGCVFKDVTREAGLLAAVNSNAACWGDYDNDGWLDLFIGCERQPNRLYHSRRDGTFEEVAARAGVLGGDRPWAKGANWLDYDNDGDLDLFVNYLKGPARLYRNDGDGIFTDVSKETGVDGPEAGFSCWAFDYDNDGWLDIYATSNDRTLKDMVKGLLGEPHSRMPNKLFHNLKGRRFEDRTGEAGLDVVFATMGSNYGDFDNDGFLDMYLGTGDLDLATLVPNRMLRNVDGRRFADITTSSGTGHLQKGHGVACGDWDRDGDLDVFIQLGGAVNGDKYHNILFQNPGQGNRSLTIKLIGKKTNRLAIGARIKLVTAGEKPMIIHRHISSGSSFGANPMEQTIGLGRADRVALLEVKWPTSGTTQVFRDIDAGQAIEVTEFAEDYRTLHFKPIPLPESP